jgi:hypothetical protein
MRQRYTEQHHHTAVCLSFANYELLRTITNYYVIAPPSVLCACSNGSCVQLTNYILTNCIDVNDESVFTGCANILLNGCYATYRSLLFQKTNYENESDIKCVKSWNEMYDLFMLISRTQTTVSLNCIYNGTSKICGVRFVSQWYKFNCSE